MNSIVTRPGFYQIQNARHIPNGRYWLTHTASNEFATIDIRETKDTVYSMGCINLVNGSPTWGYFKGEQLSRSELQFLKIL